MAKYRVKVGAHFIGDLMCRKGDVFEIPCELLCESTEGWMFEKLSGRPVQKELPVAPVEAAPAPSTKPVRRKAGGRKRGV